MDSKHRIMELELICVIVNLGTGSKILRTFKKHGICGGTITLARGTASNRIWDYLGLSDMGKEIIYMVAEKEIAYRVLDLVYHEYKLDKPNHGIAFTTSVSATIGMSNCTCDRAIIERGENNTMYQVINIIVDKGKAEDAIEAAITAGSKGGTIVNGRGSGIHETSKLFSMDVEPEKEIVIIVSEVERTEAIISAIRERLKVDVPGNGMIYVQDINRTYGILK